MKLLKHQQVIYDLVTSHNYEDTNLKIALIWSRNIGTTTLIKKMNEDLLEKKVFDRIEKGKKDSTGFYERFLYYKDEKLGEKLTLDVFTFNIAKEQEKYIRILLDYDIVDLKCYENVKDEHFFDCDRVLSQKFKDINAEMHYREYDILNNSYRNLSIGLYDDIFSEYKRATSSGQFNELLNKIKVLKELINLGKSFTEDEKDK